MDCTPSPFEALELARDVAGGQASLARICGITQPSVWKWFQSSKRLPAEHVLAVEAATGISRHELRPDIYPRGLVDGVPYDASEPLLDVILPNVPSNRNGTFDGRDRHANGGGERFYGAAGR
ncbi:MAG: helix-turn-helix domain-containing protein [Novosphingobium sp.]|nr:helix-turn-helix domain-containing protein [Novosphingobium sp.]